MLAPIPNSFCVNYVPYSFLTPRHRQTTDERWLIFLIGLSPPPGTPEAALSLRKYHCDRYLSSLFSEAVREFSQRAHLLRKGAVLVGNVACRYHLTITAMYLLQVYSFFQGSREKLFCPLILYWAIFFDLTTKKLKIISKFFQNRFFALIYCLLCCTSSDCIFAFRHRFILQKQCTDQRILIFRKSIECSAKCFKIELTKHVILNAVIIIWNNLIAGACPVFRLNVIEGYRMYPDSFCDSDK